MNASVYKQVKQVFDRFPNLNKVHFDESRAYVNKRESTQAISRDELSRIKPKTAEKKSKKD